MLGEQRGNRDRPGGRPGQRIEISERREADPVIVTEQIQRRQSRRGVGRHRRQQSLQSGDQSLDGRGVVHVGAEFHRPADSGRLTCLGLTFRQREIQIHPRGAGVHRHLGDL